MAETAEVETKAAEVKVGTVVNTGDQNKMFGSEHRVVVTVSTKSMRTVHVAVTVSIVSMHTMAVAATTNIVSMCNSVP